MRHRRAVERLRMLAEACQELRHRSPEEPLLHEAWVFGDVLDGADPIESVRLALAIDLPPDDVPWCSNPPESVWLVDTLRLNKGGFTYWWRSRHEPVWNHLIREPVRFWSLDGPDEAVLDALRERRLTDLPRASGTPDELRRRTAVELDRSLDRLREIRERYRDRDWRQEHRRAGRHPEDHLWDAVDGYVDLVDQLRRPHAQE
ncbi:DUF7711 family protein [Pseudonocardia sp. CA-107938]|uniref:DUF7711 family protein n=1 Tax=Pseudonocardia sp. CA-107938 TaxID=3240021 RepID=UPI003D9240E1